MSDLGSMPAQGKEAEPLTRPAVERGRDTAEIVAALLLGVALSSLHMLELAPTVALLARPVAWTGLLLLVAFRWNVHVPTKAPWYRLVVVTVGLFVMDRALAFSSAFASASASPSGVNLNELSPITLALFVLLLIPAAAGRELFLRGVVYTLIEERAGAAIAILGSTAAAGAVSTAWHGSPRSLAESVVMSSLFACSRALTGSVLPAVVSQLVVSGLEVLVVVLVF